MLQVDVENVMAVYQRLDEQVRALRTKRHDVLNLKNVPPCAEDPVSLDAVTVFQPKIDSITKIHAEYVTEIAEARDRLKRAAQEYGLIEDENTATLKSTAPPYNGPLLER
ncbi:PE domain-containing protein [Pseudonocardia sp. ICBG1142]|nr:PE domain-containing protein [Pseudonocardia sp. ICBG1142]